MSKIRFEGAMTMAKDMRKILIVEDDLVTRRMAEKLLMNDGYEVIKASNGTVGLTLARNEVPDLILLDVMMPDIDGMEVARRLIQAEKTADIPIVFMTMVLDVKNDKGNLKFKICDKEFPAFAKPIHRRKLLSVIRKEINKKVHQKS